ncbi:PhzF family phenazine biosynthesis protein [Nocardioides sp. Kera G14]|uniref:PhzF family phenazine biosynthesis protein n=1 Tax=Nocardioides sp. Kera G14 TaxID=2884264 RepID=UPI001D12198F|nr:PhzF family phenazine biosynthesis protein [Nocardioides sp. Kera G14]UDY25058.1 PhzF family phenazine biosynthesis protein [Nocardioides sp. Kera G14]
MDLPFRQVDVFSSTPLCGNPVAVVHDADELTTEQMQTFAAWTNLSETTFLLQPSDPRADYRVRIFTGSEELPFAGHPTLGSAHAWLESGGRPAGDLLIQECGVGLVELHHRDGLAFAAPPLIRSGPLSSFERAKAALALRVPAERIVDSNWVSNGPSFIAVLLDSAESVLAVDPDPIAFGDLYGIGIVGPWPEGSDTAVEVRVFFHNKGLTEDPVTGSFNAGVATWLTGTGRLPSSYVASQGTLLNRLGRVRIDTDDEGVIWVGGDTFTTIVGTVTL